MLNVRLELSNPRTIAPLASRCPVFAVLWKLTLIAPTPPGGTYACAHAPAGVSASHPAVATSPRIDTLRTWTGNTSIGRLPSEEGLRLALLLVDVLDGRVNDVEELLALHRSLDDRLEILLRLI